MVREQIAGAMKAAGKLWNSWSIINVGKNEKVLLNQCLQDVGKKRENALRRKNQRDRQGRPTLINWEEDDRYADDKFYQKKLTECYDQYTKTRNKILPPGR